MMRIYHYHFPIIDSTNTWCKTHFESLSYNGITLVSADFQTEGRGRLGRSWETCEQTSKENNLLASFSFVLPTLETAGNIGQLLALGTVNLLNKYDFDAYLKWPNDVMINGKKVAGILGETIQLNGMIRGIFGIGINVNASSEFLNTLAKPATSLFAESSEIYSVEAILKELTQIFRDYLRIFFKKGFKPFFKPYERALKIPEHIEVQFTAPTGIVKGTLHSLNENGTLNISIPDGSITTYFHLFD